MRKLLFSLAIAAGLTLAAAPAAQATTTIEKDIPFAITIFGCGEPITLSGHLLVSRV